MDVDDEDDLSTEPLARLLKDADILSRTTRAPAKRRKLQAGTVDIQMLPVISKGGPVNVSTIYIPNIMLTASSSLP
jgi:U3 small nucleolar RNA-associated protein 18